ncbi:MAG TPA: hypothetical protein VFT64_09420 [Rickettsiales bacterium]|nr:hypothetical protein [Rickettsiales bacterium]
MAEDVSFFQEIDEALRADKMERFMRRYGKLLLGACVAIVVGTAVSVYWKSHVHALNEKQTSIVLDAKGMIDTGQYAEAEKALEAAGKDGRISAVARMLQADALVHAGQFDKAVKVYQAIAQDSGADTAIRDRAAIQADVIASNHHLQVSAQKLPDAWNRPFFAEAGELSALQLQRAGKHKEAQDALQKLADDPGVPSSQRAMAGNLLDMIRGEK